MDAGMKRQRGQQAPNGTWFVQAVDPVSGRRVRVVGRTRAEMESRYEVLLRARSELRVGLAEPAEAAAAVARSTTGGPVTVEAVWRAHVSTLSETWAPKARSYWTRHLVELHDRRAWELTQTVVETWLNCVRSRVSHKTAENVWHVLAAAMRRAVRDRLLPALPWGDWKPRVERWKPRREAARSPEELHALVLAAARDDLVAHRAGRHADLALRVAVLALVGLRQGEAAGLGWDDLSLDTEPCIVAVTRQALDGWRERHPDWDRPRSPPKWGKRRTLALHPSAVAALRAQRDRLRAVGWYRPDGPVFPAKGGAWRSHAMVISPTRFRAVVEAAGLPNVGNWTVHSLRHSFATLEMVANGGDLRAVQARTGHGSLRVLEGYLHSVKRGLPASAIPALAPGLLSAIGADEAPLVLPTARVTYRPEDAAELAREASLLVFRRTEGPIIDTVASTVDDRREVDEARARERAERRTRTRAEWARGAAALVGLASRWLASGGGGGVRPVEVTKGAELAYTRGYAAAKRRGAPPAEARDAGAKERAAHLAKWARALGMARAKASTSTSTASTT